MFYDFPELLRNHAGPHTLSTPYIRDHLIQGVLQCEYMFELLCGLLVGLHDLEHPLSEQLVDLEHALAHRHSVDSPRVVPCQRALPADELPPRQAETVHQPVWVLVAVQLDQVGRATSAH
jgi:hypothetical protein